MTRTGTFIFCSIFVIVGTLCIMLGISEIMITKSMIENWKVTQGTIIGTYPPVPSKRKRKYTPPRAEYRYVVDREYQDIESMTEEDYVIHQSGGHIKVFYDPKNPSSSRLYLGYNYSDNIAFILFGLVFASMGIFVYRKSLAEDQQRA